MYLEGQEVNKHQNLNLLVQQSVQRISQNYILGTNLTPGRYKGGAPACFYTRAAEPIIGAKTPSKRRQSYGLPQWSFAGVSRSTRLRRRSRWPREGHHQLHRPERARPI